METQRQSYAFYVEGKKEPIGSACGIYESSAFLIAQTLEYTFSRKVAVDVNTTNNRQLISFLPYTNPLHGKAISYKIVTLGEAEEIQRTLREKSKLDEPNLGGSKR